MGINELKFGDYAFLFPVIDQPNSGFGEILQAMSGKELIQPSLLEHFSAVVKMPLNGDFKDTIYKYEPPQIPPRKHNLDGGLSWKKRGIQDLLAETFPHLVPEEGFYDILIQPKAPPRRTKYMDLSAEFAAQQQALAPEISASELDGVANLLRIAPLLTASAVLGEVLADKTQQVSDKMREQIDHLLQAYANISSPRTSAGEVLATPIPEQDRALLFNSSSTKAVQDLRKILTAAGTCNSFDNSAAELFVADARVGGSVHFQFRGGLGRTAYNRMYLAVDEEGKPFAFYDCIESGDMTRSSVRDYVHAGVEDVLLGSFAASIIIANRLGLERIAFGDLELVSLAKSIGIGERRVFGALENRTQKLGYAGAGRDLASTGPYLWTMDNQKQYRAIDPRQFSVGGIKSIIEQGYAVMRRIESNKKSIPRLREQYERYFGIIQMLVERTEHVLGETAAKVEYDIGEFCARYNLHPNKDLPEVQADAEESDTHFIPAILKYMANTGNFEKYIVTP